ncbi:MAG TPA: DUF2804 domain-containing protein [Kofleriaceae bacterium]|nr:DUF2804 domain-containing protein [Kofleriaceae bacterium]
MLGDDPSAGACTEREIVDAVDLCTPDGRLDRAAVGWSRRPLHRCRLPGSWGRRKRWDFWGITGPDFALSLTYAHLDYLGIVDVWFRDLATGRSFTRTTPVPLARGMSMPDRVGEKPIDFRGRGLELSFVEQPGGTRLRAATRARDFESEIFVERPAGHESLGVVIPWSDSRFQYTTKDVARPASGTVRVGDASYTLAPNGSSWACLDFGRGKWPYRSTWNWGAAAGFAGGTRVGLQLGGKWTVGTGMTENALSIDGRLSKLSEELVWSYDPQHWLRPWRIRTPRSERVDLVFTPVFDKVSRLGAGVIAQSIDQCFGTYSGTIVPDDRKPLTIDGLVGWAEEATWRW